MTYTTEFDSIIKLESTLSITMQREFYRLFGGVIKLKERYQYFHIVRRSVLVIDKEYWDSYTRKMYTFEMTIIDLIKVMDESIKTGTNRLFAAIQKQNGKILDDDYFFEIKSEDKKAYIKDKKKGLKSLIKRILKKVICL